MKKTLVALLGLTLALSLTACGGTDEPAASPQEDAQVTEPAVREDPALTALRQDLADSGSQCAAAFLGVLPEGGSVDDLLTQSGCLEDYPFLADCPVVTHAGAQVFFLIPQDREVSVLVQDYICDESNHYQGEVGETLYEGENGQPVILVCNINDVMPNLMVTLEGTDGAVFAYSPALELCGGTLFIPAGAAIRDVSNYETVSRQETPAPSVDFTGRWSAYEDFDGARVSLELTFREDGTMEYLCGYANSELLSDYEGIWYVITEGGQYPAGSIVLDMTDTMEGGGSFFGVFTVTAESGTITLTQVSGDSLLYGFNGKGITFFPATNG